VNATKEAIMRKFCLSKMSYLGIICMVMLASACSTGYNKYANEYYEQGLIFYDQMEYGRAIDNFTKVLELAPQGKDNHLVYYNRGYAYYKNRQYDKALYDFTKALEIAPPSDKKITFQILKARGDAYLATNDIQGAIDDYTKALLADAKHVKAKFVYLSRGLGFQRLKDHPLAIQDFSQAVSLDHQLAAAYFSRGSSWYQLGDYERALFDAKEAAKLKPGTKEYEDLLYDVQAAMKKG
jgi:tetratricopeptide (TPR) repeat protein